MPKTNTILNTLICRLPVHTLKSLILDLKLCTEDLRSYNRDFRVMIIIKFFQIINELLKFIFQIFINGSSQMTITWRTRHWGEIGSTETRNGKRKKIGGTASFLVVDAESQNALSLIEGQLKIGIEVILKVEDQSDTKQKWDLAKVIPGRFYDGIVFSILYESS